jgi:hypothetical protein
MDTFSACLAFGPLGVYLLLLGIVNLAPRPMIVSGTRELVSLGLALAGLMIVGPMQLFMPEEAAGRFGWGVWALLGAFYALCLSLVVMLNRPRLVVYNVTLDTLRTVLAETAAALDHDSNWAGRALSMPQMRVHLQLESYPPLGNASMVATGGDQSVGGWRRLEGAMRRALRSAPPARRPGALWMALVGLAILATLGFWVADDPQTIARGLDRMLHP